jgi:hypothetical protein
LMKKKMMPAMLLRIQKATMAPTTPTPTMAATWVKDTGLLLSRLLTSLLTDPMLRSRHGC